MGSYATSVFGDFVENHGNEDAKTLTTSAEDGNSDDDGNGTSLPICAQQPSNIVTPQGQSS